MTARLSLQSGVPQGQVISSGTITPHADGTCSITGGGASAVPPNWFSAQNPGIGAAYWINITRIGGTGGVNFSKAQGVWTKMNSFDITGSIAAAGAAGSCNGTYQIASDSGGSNIVASGTISCNNTV
jgi:hypothetical protein